MSHELDAAKIAKENKLIKLSSVKIKCLLGAGNLTNGESPATISLWKSDAIA